MGTRGSALALTQSSSIVAQLRRHHPDLDIEQVTIQTSGDKFKGDYLAEAGGKGLFAKEIEEALLRGEIDFAVHSLKDLPGFLAEGLILACYPKREDARDCLIVGPSAGIPAPCLLHAGTSFAGMTKSALKELPRGAKIGTSSPRRAAQILSLRPDCKTAPMRGNVDTRLRKLEQGDCDAILLAAAGLNRLHVIPTKVGIQKKLDSGWSLPRTPIRGRNDVFFHFLEIDKIVPAVGQGILGIETRKNEMSLIELLREALEDPDTALAARAERSFLAAVGGDCYSPIAAHASMAGGRIKMSCWIGSPDGKRFVRLDQTADRSQPELFGESLAKEALEKGGRKILDEAPRYTKT